jgi:hypothetical protein
MRCRCWVVIFGGQLPVTATGNHGLKVSAADASYWRPLVDQPA